MSQSINLFNPHLLPPRPLLTFRKLLWTALLVMGLGTIGFGFLYVQESRMELNLDSAKAQLSAKKGLLEARRQAQAPNNAFEKLLMEAKAELDRQKRLDAIINNARLGDRQGYSRYLTAIARRSLSGVWLTGIDIRAQNDGLTLIGEALSPKFVPEYIGSLESETVLQGKQFSTLEVKASTYKGYDIVKFNLHSSIEDSK
ncbi:MAG TPA: PilN domain-containing protein [Burkholderiales bacterium]|nr:PilN domain-containing protein [Burkholderiales bacterium]